MAAFPDISAEMPRVYLESHCTHMEPMATVEQSQPLNMEERAIAAVINAHFGPKEVEVLRDGKIAGLGGETTKTSLLISM